MFQFQPSPPDGFISQPGERETLLRVSSRDLLEEHAPCTHLPVPEYKRLSTRHFKLLWLASTIGLVESRPRLDAVKTIEEWYSTLVIASYGPRYRM